jgi:drug/metabolite transporter (DMT)-like permease
MHAPHTPAGHRQGILLLLVVTLIWGSTFVVIKGAVADLPPNGLMILRFTVAGLACLPLVRGGRELWTGGRALWRGALELGFWLWAGYASQAFGLLYTTASRSAFITSFSVVLVPVLSGLAGRPVPRAIWAAAGLALIGVALLSGDGAPPNVGDAWTLVTAFAYAIYVLRLEKYAGRSESGPLAAAQIWGVLPFALAGSVMLGLGRSGGAPVASGAAAVAPGAGWIEVAAGIPPATWLAVLYLALIATAMTTVLQTYGQRRVSAPEAALIFAAEPVWAALFAFVFLGERLGLRGWIGAGLVIGATVLSQWRAMRRV